MTTGRINQVSVTWSQRQNHPVITGKMLLLALSFVCVQVAVKSSLESSDVPKWQACHPLQRDFIFKSSRTERFLLKEITPCDENRGKMLRLPLTFYVGSRIRTYKYDPTWFRFGLILDCYPQSSHFICAEVQPKPRDSALIFLHRYFSHFFFTYT